MCVVSIHVHAHGGLLAGPRRTCLLAGMEVSRRWRCARACACVRVCVCAQAAEKGKDGKDKPKTPATAKVIPGGVARVCGWRSSGQRGCSDEAGGQCEQELSRRQEGS